MRFIARGLYAAVFVVMVSLAAPVVGSQAITASEAHNYVGETATVCGNVADTRYAVSSRGQPTFINLEKAYPNQMFTVVVWGSDRQKFGAPEKVFLHRHICANGLIQNYRGTPEIIAHSPIQIRTKVDDTGTTPPSVPAGATAQCRDGTYSYSQHHRGTCSHHGGVATWLN